MKQVDNLVETILSFEEMTDIEKIKFTEWMYRNYKDFILYSALGLYERKTWNHFYPRPSTAEGYFIPDKSSGE